MNAVILLTLHSSTYCKIMTFLEHRIKREEHYDSNHKDWNIPMSVMMKESHLYINGTAINPFD